MEINKKFYIILRIAVVMIVIVIGLLNSCGYVNDYNEKVANIENLYTKSNDYGFDEVWRREKKDVWDVDKDYYFIDRDENFVIKVHCDYQKRRQKASKLLAIDCDMSTIEEAHMDLKEYAKQKIFRDLLKINVYEEIGNYLFEARKDYIIYNKRHYSKKISY